ncbi:MAG: carbohydrate kinase family protein, partial [Anaerolineales bacterium]|nr:carbohydrate kinase family protein [Anaerolineales bacterium]
MKIVITGSIAFDYLMTFPGRFSEHILPDRIEDISLSFLVDNLILRPGGIAANIAYTLALLGERPLVMATVGPDFEEHRQRLELQGVDTSAIKVIPDLFTASFFVNTDQANCQIASFYPGAMAKASELSFKEIDPVPDMALISPNDPQAMIEYVQECSELGIPYAYDPSQQIVRLSSEELSEGINGAHSLFSNDYEFGLIEEKTGLNIEGMLKNTAFIVITRGENGADLFTAEGQVHVPAVTPERIADPTGIGDAFRGGFMKGYLNDLPLLRCAEMGVMAATFCIEAEGPQSHSFSLDGFIERYRRNFDDSG